MKVFIGLGNNLVVKIPANPDSTMYIIFLLVETCKFSNVENNLKNRKDSIKQAMISIIDMIV